MTRATRRPGRLGLAGPAILWTAAVLRRAARASWPCRALGQRVAGGRSPGWTLANYARFFAKPYSLRGAAQLARGHGAGNGRSASYSPIRWPGSSPSGCRRAGSVWRCCSRSCRSGRPISCGPTAGCWCCRPRASCPRPLRAARPRSRRALVSNRTGTVIGFVHFFTMLLTLTIYASLVQIPPSCLRAAADLGASPWQTFLRVTLPLSAAGRRGRRVPHLRARHRRLHHAADPRRQPRAAAAAGDHAADRPAGGLPDGLGAVAGADGWW